ncbi:MAG: hypothetical protein AB7N71_02695 [Phycisphaerae bacterium]
MFEVHTGARPGRPIILLLTAAIVLMITLGVARLQVAAKSALGVAVRLQDSPFMVRPPKGWSESKEQPGRFYHSSEGRGLFSEWQDQRAVEFHYVMMYPGVTARDAAAFLVENVSEHVENARPASIGPWPGIEFQRSGAIVQGNQAIARIEICRVAVSPRGDALIAQYRTFGTPTLGDLTRFDDICDAVTLSSDANVDVAQDDTVASCGIRLKTLPAWTFFRPALAATPGFFASRADDAAPITLEIIRTWQSQQRPPRALALDLAAERWNTHPADLEARDLPLSPDIAVVALNRPHNSTDRSTLVQLGAVSHGDEVLLYCAYSPKLTPKDADGVIREVFADVQFTPLALYENLAGAKRSGKTVIENIRDHGIRHYWQTPIFRDVFASDDGVTQIRQERTRRIREFRGVTLHEGETTLVFASPGIAKPLVLYHEQWQSNDDCSRFELSGTLPLEQPPVEYVEKRESATGLVSRQISGAVTRRYTYQPGPNFAVDPPLGELVRVALATGEEEQVLIETPAIRGNTTAYELLTVLERSPQRVTILTQSDFRPDGILHIMDAASGELVETKSARTHLLRVTANK